MKFIKESIFSSAIRSFCIAFFSVIGIVIAIFVLVLIFGAGKSVKSMEHSTYEIIIPDTNGRKYIPASKPLILRINITGTIAQGEITVEKIRSLLNETEYGSLKGNKIKAILIYMNSPGGGAISSDGIYECIKRYGEKKQIPIYTYVDGLCASGGMYIACASSKIYASSPSMIGSIGAFTMFFNVSQTMDKVGVKNITISKGLGKTDMNPFQPVGPSDDENYVTLLDATYNQFINVVAQNRTQVSKDDLINKYGAKVFTAQTAEQIGLIDGADYQLEDVTEMLAKDAQIENYQVITLQEKTKLTEFFKFSKSLMSPQTSLQYQNLIKHSSKLSEPQWYFDAPALSY